MIVSRTDLRRLTGTRNPAEQIRILQARGIHPFVDKHGRPQVTWEAVNKSMVSGKQHFRWEAFHGAA